MKQLFFIALFASLLQVYIHKQQDNRFAFYKKQLGLSYKEHILPIIQKNCAMCHNGNWPDRNWLKYDIAFKYKDRIKQRLQNRTMPLGVIMPEEERQKMIEWVNKGAKP